MTSRLRMALRCSLVAGLVALSCACGPTAMDMFPLGGGWHMYLHQSFVIEAGHRPSDIYREWKGRRVLVARDVEFHEYYAGPDCLLWETKARDNHVVSGACGEHEPIVIARDDYHRWTMEARGLVNEDDAGIRERGVAVRPTEMFSIDDIAAASARQPTFSGGWSLVSARSDGSLRPVEVDVPIDVNAINVVGRTALMDAAVGRDVPPGSRVALVNALLEQGANLNATDKFGMTTLMIAADRGHVDVVRRLMRAGADIHALTIDGRTALMEAAGSLDNQVEMVTMLLEAGADKEVRDKYGRTAFSAIRTNTDPQLKVLLALK